VKRSYFLINKNMVEATKKGSKLLESIDHINTKSFVLEDKWAKIQNKILEK
jgi:hypothetical protein